jgi:hypothetical protein
VTVLLTLEVVVVGVRLGVEEVVVRVYWLVCLLMWLVLLVYIVVFYGENWLVFLKCLVATLIFLCEKNSTQSISLSFNLGIDTSTINNFATSA